MAEGQLTYFEEMLITVVPLTGMPVQRLKLLWRQVKRVEPELGWMLVEVEQMKLGMVLGRLEHGRTVLGRQPKMAELAVGSM